MVNALSFCTPIRYQGSITCKKYFTEAMDGYFDLRRKQIAYIISDSYKCPQNSVVIKQNNQNLCEYVITVVVKVISYATVIIPIIMITAKIIFRSTHKFHIISVAEAVKAKKMTQPLPPVPGHAAIPSHVDSAKRAAIRRIENKGRPLPQTPPVVMVPVTITKVEGPAPAIPTEVSAPEGRPVPALVPGIQLPPAALLEQVNTLPEQPLTVTVVAPVVEAPVPGVVSALMDQFTKAWKSDTGEFDFSKRPFDLGKFTKTLVEHAEKFLKPDVKEADHFGYIEKFDVPENAQISVRADLHGDLKSLIELVRTLQERGLLDETFKCKPGVHLVFLGDYCDRGFYGTQVLEMLIALREENPTQVHLIRGNHETLMINGMYGAADKNLMTIIGDENSAKALDNFYQTLSLTTYIGVNTEGAKEYVQFTHGLFELSMDPSPLLDAKNSGEYLPVPKERNLSDRITRIMEDGSNLSQVAKRLNDLVTGSIWLEESMTCYNWADVSQDDVSRIGGNLSERTYKICPEDIQTYLDLSSISHRVEMVVRGHEHRFQHFQHKGKVILTTLPVGVDVRGYERYVNQDRAYILHPKHKVQDWMKQAVLRERRKQMTDSITDLVPLTSDKI